MTYLIGYVAVLIPFAAIDVVWLWLMGPLLYRPTLGDILLDHVRLGPALAFYLVYPVGLLLLAVTPGLKSNSVATAIGSGVLLGAIAYSTYDLTNFATLRNWTLQLTILDIAYGATVSGLAALISFLVVRALSNT